MDDPTTDPQEGREETDTEADQDTGQRPEGPSPDRAAPVREHSVDPGGGWVRRGGHEDRLSPHHRRLLFLESFFGNFLFSICMLFGVSMTTVQDVNASGGEPDRAARLAPLVPMQRAGSADEVAAAIVWLLSDAASYTTGAILDVGGGR